MLIEAERVRYLAFLGLSCIYRRQNEIFLNFAWFYHEVVSGKLGNPRQFNNESGQSTVSQNWLLRAKKVTVFTPFGGLPYK